MGDERLNSNVTLNYCIGKWNVGLKKYGFDANIVSVCKIMGC